MKKVILISIDGDAALTNGHRGAGVYETVTNAARKIREGGFIKSHLFYEIFFLYTLGRTNDLFALKFGQG